MSASYGYVRVSTREQNEDRQMIALNGVQIPARNIYVDKQSGRDFRRQSYGASSSEDLKNRCLRTLGKSTWSGKKRRFPEKKRQKSAIWLWRHFTGGPKSGGRRCEK